MSYILDALRKADAERDRGNVPGIHAQPSFGGAAPASAQPAATPWGWLAAGALAVLLVGALAWYLLGGTPRGAADPALARPDATAPASVAAAPVAVAPVTAAPLPAAPVPAAPLPAAPNPPAAPPKAQRVEPAPAARKPRPAAPSTAVAPSSSESKPGATAERVYALNELPDDIRRQLPNVSVGGSMYSTRPADRLLIINGQVLHEGDKIAPDLVLQQIRLKGALLNFKGYRYTISF